MYMYKNQGNDFFFCGFLFVLSIIEQIMKRSRQTYTHSCTHIVIMNEQSLENHTLVFIFLNKNKSFLVMHT